LYVFVGSIVNVTLTAGQALMGSVTTSLSATSATTAYLGLCYQLGAGSLTTFTDDYHADVSIGTILQLYTISSVTTGLAAGSYTVGMCANHNPKAFDGDWTSGFVQVLPPGTSTGKPGQGSRADARSGEPPVSRR
jgi:hypothetical protein